MKNSNLLLAKSIGCFLLVGLFFSACQDETVSPTPNQALVKVKAYGTDPISPRFEVPAHMERNETGTYCLHLFDNRKLYFEIKVNNLSASDRLTVAHIHTGGPLDAGPVFVGLVDDNAMKFDSNNSIKDTIDLTEEQFQRILAGNDLYINIHSEEQPAGLLRNQLDHPLQFGADIDLLPENEIPPAVTGASGTAMVRIAEDKMIFSNVTVTNLDAGDALSVAHIHTGASTVNGPPFVFLANNSGEFGVNRSFVLDDDDFNTIFSSPVYINAHSNYFPNGLARGQLRE